MKADNDNKKRILTQDRVVTLLRYEAETGNFHWRAYRNGMPAGSLAGMPSSNGYWRLNIDGGKYPAHRVAWLYVYGSWPERMLDHINMDKRDNRIANLRIADGSTNQHNRTSQSNNTSGFKGVSQFKKTGRWRAEIAIGGVKKYLGSYDTKELAAQAYDQAAMELHKGFARNATGRLVANDNDSELAA